MYKEKYIENMLSKWLNFKGPKLVLMSLNCQMKEKWATQKEKKMRKPKDSHIICC